MRRAEAGFAGLPFKLELRDAELCKIVAVAGAIAEMVKHLVKSRPKSTLWQRSTFEIFVGGPSFDKQRVMRPRNFIYPYWGFFEMTLGFGA